MEEVIPFDSVAQFNAYNNHETLHPLVSVVDLSQAKPRKHRKMNYGLYAIYLKEVKCGDLRYGCSTYDYEEGTLVFIGPGQVIGSNEEDYFQPRGWALVFHPDFLLGTSLSRHIHDYTFFSYAVNEALHLSERERLIILDCLSKIKDELEHGVDKHSKKLIVTTLELFLNYCVRFYDRQFVTREQAVKGIVARFETMLHQFFQSEKPQTIGLPSVAYCAAELNLSANYFGDVIKKETGKTAQEYIHLKLISIAKERVFDPTQSISEIAYELGFRYPQHFSRFFKQQVGVSPVEYRGSMN